MVFLLVSTVYVHAKNQHTVGIAYSTWHNSTTWQRAWGTPALGQYESGDSQVIKQHAEWLAEAGVDFIFVDWSNDLPYAPSCNCRPDIQFIEDATYKVFDIYEQLERHPKIAIMIGFDAASALADGSLQRKADQVYRDFIANSHRAPHYEKYEGKPLLMVYVGTPAPFQNGLPPWNDPRFTIRWLTGFITEQPALLGPDRLSKFGYWSWEDRGPQSFSVEGEHPEAMTVTASWRSEDAKVPARTRMGGSTFVNEWARAREKDVKMALIVSWNEWVIEEQINSEASKDLEPSVEFGDFYLKLLKSEIDKFKGR
jgi:hypothetical protein